MRRSAHLHSRPGRIDGSGLGIGSGFGSALRISSGLLSSIAGLFSRTAGLVVASGTAFGSTLVAGTGAARLSSHPPLGRDACSAFAQGNPDAAQYQVVETSRRPLLVVVVDLGEFGIDDILVA